MDRPTAAPLVNGLVIQVTPRPDFGMREVRVLGQHQREPGTLDFSIGCGGLGRHFAGLGQLLGRELGLVVRLRQGHRDLRGAVRAMESRKGTSCHYCFTNF